MTIECRLEAGQTPLDWYKKELKQLERSHKFAVTGLNTFLQEIQSKCQHEWTRYEDLFYAIGNTAPGMRCDKCGCERHLTDDERYPNKVDPGLFNAAFRKVFGK